jgi:hypothetical protein
MEDFRNYQGGRQGGGSRRSGYRRSGDGGYRRPVVRQNLGGTGRTGGGPWWGWQYGYYIPSNYPFFEYNPYVPYDVVEVIEYENKKKLEKKIEKKVEKFESVKYVYPEFLK